MNARLTVLTATLAAAALAGCASEGELAVVAEGVGVTAVRTACPSVGVPDYTGDITTFRAPGDRSAGNMDVTATITNLRSTCNENGEQVYTEATFDVLARRTDVRGERIVTLPYFTTVLQGGSAVQSKRVGSVTLRFADGQERAEATGRAGSFVERAAATLPADIRERITRKRKPGDPDAALDPLADPQVRAALQRATFEMLIGFQLTEDQLAYNVTR
ncbi:hypothetical protein [Erythrobacter sp. HKB08]|uniref:hypothetical protein n=1 Tax=Erythrobacter sp. HKB08 TaxID=2502843 RepID=UPI0010091972|nr:hypothetical protein [Erythrobacter sp. HKB08]